MKELIINGEIWAKYEISEKNIFIYITYIGNSFKPKKTLVQEWENVIIILIEIVERLENKYFKNVGYLNIFATTEIDQKERKHFKEFQKNDFEKIFNSLSEKNKTLIKKDLFENKSNSIFQKYIDEITVYWLPSNFTLEMSKQLLKKVFENVSES